MAFPTILVDSATGSDTAASGAGPSTAITGTKARTKAETSGSNRIGFFETSEPDLSGVATDGSHVVCVFDTAAGNRNFASISAKFTQITTTGTNDSGSYDTVTVASTTGLTVGDPILIPGAGAAGADLYTLIATITPTTTITISPPAQTEVTDATITRPAGVVTTSGEFYTLAYADETWAIGGKRDSIGSTNSRLLFENNSAAGDAMPGWTIQIAENHTENVTANITPRRSGGANGPISIVGVGSATTCPRFNLTGNNHAFMWLVGNYIHFDNLQIDKTAGTTGSNTTILALGSFCIVKNCSIGVNAAAMGSPPSIPIIGISTGTTGCKIINCNITYVTTAGIVATSAAIGTIIENNYIHDLTTAACIAIKSLGRDDKIFGNLLYNNVIGISLGVGTNTYSAAYIKNNTIDGGTANTPIGISVLATNTQYNGFYGLAVVNNNITRCTTGISISDASAPTVAQFKAGGAIFWNNNFGGATYTNTNDITAGYESLLENSSTTDSYVSSTDLNPSLHLQGFSATAIGIGSSVLSYTDIGAAQRIHDYPTAANTIAPNTTNGVTGTYHAPEASEVWNTAVFGPGSGTSGTMNASDIPVTGGAGATLAATEIKKDVVVDDLTGTYEGAGGNIIVIED